MVDIDWCQVLLPVFLFEPGTNEGVIIFTANIFIVLKLTLLKYLYNIDAEPQHIYSFSEIIFFIINFISYWQPLFTVILNKCIITFWIFPLKKSMLIVDGTFVHKVNID